MSTRYMYNQCFSTKLAGLQFWLSKSLFEHYIYTNDYSNSLNEGDVRDTCGAFSPSLFKVIPVPSDNIFSKVHIKEFLLSRHCNEVVLIIIAVIKASKAKIIAPKQISIIP